MKLKHLFTVVVLIFLSDISFAQKKKNKQKEVVLSVDSLYSLDILSVKQLYSKLKVNEMSNYSSTFDMRKAQPQEVSVSVRYPQVAKENGIHGRVYCRFLLDSLGEMKDIKIIKGLAGGCSQEVVRALTELSVISKENGFGLKRDSVIYQKMYFDFKLQ